MKVVIILEQPVILEILKDPNAVNPGVGGTTFTALRLALELHNSKNFGTGNLDIFIGAIDPSVDSYLGIKVINLNKSNIFCDILIVTGGTLDKLILGEIFIRYKKLIAWIRHPYDMDKINKARSLKAELVSVGKVQYLSNLLFSGFRGHHQIDNLFDARRIRLEAGWSNSEIYNCAYQPKTELIKIGYMGALIHSKGFHKIAEIWSEIMKDIRNSNINVQLEVIGGSSLYGFNEDHEILPCASNYGDMICSALGNELNTSVRFYGTLGPERYRIMNSCDLAIVNPSGQGEAFPATILEWLCLGIPTISSQKYGCGDAMRFLPLLRLSGSNGIKDRIMYYLNCTREEKRDLIDESIRVSNLFSSKKEYIISQWEFLIQNKHSDLLVNDYLNKYIYLSLFLEWIKMLCMYLKIFLSKFKLLAFLKSINKFFK